MVKYNGWNAQNLTKNLKNALCFGVIRRVYIYRKHLSFIFYMAYEHILFPFLANGTAHIHQFTKPWLQKSGSEKQIR